MTQTAASAATTRTRPVHRAEVHFPRSVIPRPVMHLRGARSSNGTISVYSSGNWSGYVALPKGKSTTSFDYVQSTFTVPSVNCSDTDGEGYGTFAYHWVGLDGFSDGTVEQDGAADFCEGGTAYYYIWWETYPGGFNTVDSVNPGDEITAYVYHDGSYYYLYVYDDTQGYGFDYAEPCQSGSTCNDSSAEVITEGYHTSGYWLGTSDYASEGFGAIQACNQKPICAGLEYSKWSTAEIYAVGSVTDDVTSQPGPLDNSAKPQSLESSFVNYYYGED
ncbi:MAG: G1 family glutamic endopeptidase [Acidimicrobiales bacterium]